MTTSAMETTRRRSLPVGTIILVVLVIIGAIAAVIRFSQGLGVATNLNDDLPWGLWIGFDVMSGVALAAGGFTMAAVVYIFRLERFYPLVRPAILTAFIGYILAAGSILFDLGRPDRFYNPFFYWNINSVMFEIAWSVLTYLGILAVENTSLVAERFGLKRLLRFLRKVVIPIVIVGIIISTMHQSSLGALFLLVPQRLSPLWYTPFLPVLFYITAIAAGFAMVIVEASLSASADGRKPETKLLSELGKWLPWILGLYLALKVILLIVEGKISYLFAGNVETILFWIEIIVGVIAPIIILSQKRLRNSPVWLFRAALLVVIGIILNRFNVMFSGEGNILYAPSWIELAVTAGLISLGILLYMFGSKHFPVLDQEPH